MGCFANRLRGGDGQVLKSGAGQGSSGGAPARVPQLSRRLVTRNRPLSRADVMITGVAPPVTRRTGTSQERLCAGQRSGARLRPLTGERLRSSDAGIFARRPLPDWSGRGGPAGASGLVSAPVALAPWSGRCLT